MFQIFMVFICVWVVLGFWATSRKWHDAIAWGGTFVVSLVIVVGSVQLVDHYKAWEKRQPAQAQQQKGQINQDQILIGLGDFAPALERGPTVDGRERALGKMRGGSVGLLEVSGKSLAHEVEKSTLAFPAVLQDKAIAATNMKMAARYVQTLFPEWVSPETWLASNALTTVDTKTIEREGRRITVTLSQELNMWFLTVDKI